MTDRTPHPTRYSAAVLEQMETYLRDEAKLQGKRPSQQRVLDPMAGTGLIHSLPGRTVGIEIEPEWASYHPRTKVGDATALPFADDYFDVIAVSPAYGNRFADHHEAKDGSRRRSYRHDLGRMPSEGSSGTLPYGQAYRELHTKAWTEATRVLRPGGLFILNVKNFYRTKKIMRVSEWHVYELFRLGYALERAEMARTPGMKFGANRDRVDAELIAALRAP